MIGVNSNMSNNVTDITHKNGNAGNMMNREIVSRCIPIELTFGNKGSAAPSIDGDFNIMGSMVLPVNLGI